MDEKYLKTASDSLEAKERSAIRISRWACSSQKKWRIFENVLALSVRAWTSHETRNKIFLFKHWDTYLTLQMCLYWALPMRKTLICSARKFVHSCSHALSWFELFQWIFLVRHFPPGRIKHFFYKIFQSSVFSRKEDFAVVSCAINLWVEALQKVIIIHRALKQHLCVLLPAQRHNDSVFPIVMFLCW